MPPRGRRGTTVATPATLKLLEGARPGRDSGGRAVKEPPAFRRLPPERPVDLSPDAGEMWDLVVGELSRVELLKPLDGPALRAACETYARLRSAIRARQDCGITCETSQGVGVAPWVRVEAEAGRALRQWCAEFGLSPAAEARIGSGPQDGDDGNPFAG
jgi:P27 family predicted phage terminase small subunit